MAGGVEGIFGGEKVLQLAGGGREYRGRAKGAEMRCFLCLRKWGPIFCGMGGEKSCGERGADYKGMLAGPSGFLKSQLIPSSILMGGPVFLRFRGAAND
jgi:hypothetical protein